jgi:hypothetical protein
VYGVPNGLVEYQLIVMAIDVSGARHSLPSDVRVTRLEFGRQPARRLGYNFEATRDGINGATICKELVNGCLTNEQKRQVYVFANIGQRTNRKSEGIDGICGGRRPNVRFERVLVHHVNRFRKERGNKVFQFHIGKDVE